MLTTRSCRAAEVAGLQGVFVKLVVEGLPRDAQGLADRADVARGRLQGFAKHLGLVLTDPVGEAGIGPGRAAASSPSATLRAK